MEEPADDKFKVSPLTLVDNEPSIIKKEGCSPEAENSLSRYCGTSPSKCPVTNLKTEVLEDATFSEDEGSVGPGCSSYTDAFTKQELDIGPTELRPRDMQYMLQSCKPDPDHHKQLRIIEDIPQSLLALEDEEFSQQPDNQVLLEKSPWSLPQGMCGPMSPHDARRGQIVSHSAHTDTSRTIQEWYIDLPHKCKTCLASFRKPSDLLKHEMIHSSRDKLRCDLCGSMFLSKSAITLHLKYHDSASMLCWICGKLLKEISFRQHPCFAVHKMLSCPICNEKFKSQPARLKHLYVTHTVHNTAKNREKKTKQYIYKCKECRIDFTLLSKLRHHRSVVHNEKGEFVCECGKTYWKQFELLRHQKKHLKSKGFHVIKK